MTLGEDTVGLEANTLLGSSGPGGVDSNAMARMLVSFGGHSRKLRCAFSRLTMWLANGHPPWEAYEAMMIGRLVGFDKMPGVRPLGIGDIIRRLVAKCGLKVMGQEATRACGTTNT